MSSYSEEPSWGTYNESLLDNYRDEADQAVYAAVVARFESDWERNPQAQSCLQAVARRALASNPTRTRRQLHCP